MVIDQVILITMCGIVIQSIIIQIAFLFLYVLKHKKVVVLLRQLSAMKKVMKVQTNLVDDLVKSHEARIGDKFTESPLGIKTIEYRKFAKFLCEE